MRLEQKATTVIFIYMKKPPTGNISVAKLPPSSGTSHVEGGLQKVTSPTVAPPKRLRIRVQRSRPKQAFA